MGSNEWCLSHHSTSRLSEGFDGNRWDDLLSMSPKDILRSTSLGTPQRLMRVLGVVKRKYLRDLPGDLSFVCSNHHRHPWTPPFCQTRVTSPSSPPTRLLLYLTCRSQTIVLILLGLVLGIPERTVHDVRTGFAFMNDLLAFKGEKVTACSHFIINQCVFTILHLPNQTCRPIRYQYCVITIARL